MVADLLAALARDLAGELPGLKVAVDVRVPDGTRIALDSDKMRRVIGNMAANAPPSWPTGAPTSDSCSRSRTKGPACPRRSASACSSRS